MYSCICAHFFLFNFFIIIFFAFIHIQRRLEKVVLLGHLFTEQSGRQSLCATGQPEWKHIKASVEAETRRLVSCYFILKDDKKRFIK